MSDSTTTAFIQSLLGGRPLFGSSGIDFLNTLAQQGAGYTNGQIDPRLYQYFSVSNQQGGENPVTQYTPNAGNNLTNTGAIRLNGQDYVQVGGATDNTTIKNRDPSMFQYDPNYGELTPASNVMSGSDPFSDIAPWAMLAMAGAGASGLFDGLGGAASGGATSGGTGAFDVGGSTGFGGSTALSSGVSGGAGAAGATGATGATGAAAGSPALDVFAPGMSGPGAVDDFLIQHGMSGLAGGPLSSLLGGNFAQAGSSLLSGAMNNPLQALGLLQMGSGLIGSHSSSSGGGKSAGGTGLPAPQGRPGWSPNPYTQQQIQQLYGPGAR